MLRLTPVIATTTGQEDSIPVRQRVVNQSLAARVAVQHSARESGFAIQKLEKNEREVPQPDGDIYWSLSHTSTLVAGVVAPCQVGIDIEGPRRVRDELLRKIVSDAEAELLGGRDEHGFLRAWTAKEAFLKSIGLGVAGLSRCKIVRVVGPQEIHLEFDSQTHLVYQTTVDGHVAALCLTPPRNDEDSEISIDWIQS